MALFKKHQAGPAAAQAVNSDFILEAIQDGVATISGDGVIRSFNSAAATLTGWSVQEAVGLDYRSVFKLVDNQAKPLLEQENAFTQALQTHQTTKDSNAVMQTRNNKTLAVSVIVSPVMDPSSGRPNGSVVAVFRDISKEKEEEARRSDFISTASHEMRTPITAIEGYLALALNSRTAQIDDRARSLLEKASMSTKHLGELFRDLLTSSKAEDGRLISYPSVVDAGKIIEQVAEAARFRAQEKGLELSFAVNSEQTGGKVVRPLYYVYADPNRIQEVFQNIVDNAIKYTMAGQVDVRLTGDSSTVQVQVKDTGGGIKAEDIPHLFQKFYRVDNSTTRTVGGTGLGLYICRKIVELYSGRIWVESEYGKGSTFFINLPRLSNQQAQEILQRQATTVSPLDGPKV
jgi:PAS domain S-box-containing protein